MIAIPVSIVITFGLLYFGDVKLNLINNRDKLLSFLDDEIIDALSRAASTI